MLYGIGGSGYGWSSSVLADSNAYDLYLSNGGIFPLATAGRANGLQVRCLQE